VPNHFGGGVSSSPSNTPPPFERGRFPRVTTYDNVRADLGDFPEINALDAWPTGRGVGTQIVGACERFAIERGVAHIGIAVDETNTGARRLYQRLGYTEWGQIVDTWGEFNDAGEITVEHNELGIYLVKHL